MPALFPAGYAHVFDAISDGDHLLLFHVAPYAGSFRLLFRG
jgi:hypothetical protein